MLWRWRALACAHRARGRGARAQPRRGAPRHDVDRPDRAARGGGARRRRRGACCPPSRGAPWWPGAACRATCCCAPWPSPPSRAREYSTCLGCSPSVTASRRASRGSPLTLTGVCGLPGRGCRARGTPASRSGARLPCRWGSTTLTLVGLAAAIAGALPSWTESSRASRCSASASAPHPRVTAQALGARRQLRSRASSARPCRSVARQPGRRRPSPCRPIVFAAVPGHSARARRPTSRCSAPWRCPPPSAGWWPTGCADRCTGVPGRGLPCPGEGHRAVDPHRPGSAAADPVGPERRG